MAGFLFQAVQALGIPPECVENIAMTLTGFVEDALLHFTNGNLQLSGCIRVFCQKKMLDLVNFNESFETLPYRTGYRTCTYYSSFQPKYEWGMGIFLD